MIIRRAVLEDADRLVEMRRTFQQEAKGNPGSEAFARSVKAYLEKHIPAGTCIVWLAEEGEEVACCAILSCVEELPTQANPGGRKGYLHNVFTLPAYRRQGLAEKVVKGCLQSAKEWGAGLVHWGATAAGRPLYEKLGFQLLDGEMELDLQAESAL